MQDNNGSCGNGSKMGERPRKRRWGASNFDIGPSMSGEIPGTGAQVQVMSPKMSTPTLMQYVPKQQHTIPAAIPAPPPLTMHGMMQPPRPPILSQQHQIHANGGGEVMTMQEMLEFVHPPPAPPQVMQAHTAFVPRPPPAPVQHLARPPMLVPPISAAQVPQAPPFFQVPGDTPYMHNRESLEQPRIPMKESQGRQQQSGTEHHISALPPPNHWVQQMAPPVQDFPAAPPPPLFMQQPPEATQQIALAARQSQLPPTRRPPFQQPSERAPYEEGKGLGYSTQTQPLVSSPPLSSSSSSASMIFVSSSGSSAKGALPPTSAPYPLSQSFQQTHESPLPGPKSNVANILKKLGAIANSKEQQNIQSTTDGGQAQQTGGNIDALFEDVKQRTTIPSQEHLSQTTPPEALPNRPANLDSIVQKLSESSSVPEWVPVTEEKFKARLDRALQKNYDYLARKDRGELPSKDRHRQNTGDAINMKLQEKAMKAYARVGIGAPYAKDQAKEAPVEERKIAESTAVYVSGLPRDISDQDLGKIKKIKIYTDDRGNQKGDALITYFRPEMAHRACHQYNNLNIEEGFVISVTLADYSAKDKGNGGTETAQVDHLAPASRMPTGYSSTHLSSVSTPITPPLPPECEADRFPVVLLWNAYNIEEANSTNDPNFFIDLEADMLLECVKFGKVVRIISPEEAAFDGCVAVTYETADGAQGCASALHARWFGGQQIEAQVVSPAVTATQAAHDTEDFLNSLL